MQWFPLFSCPGSSKPTLLVGGTFEFGHKEWLLSLETLQTYYQSDVWQKDEKKRLTKRRKGKKAKETKRQRDRETKRQKDKNTKRQRTLFFLILWHQGSCAIFYCDAWQGFCQDDLVSVFFSWLQDGIQKKVVLCLILDVNGEQRQNIIKIVNFCKFLSFTQACQRDNDL